MYQMLLDCYLSGQINERQWSEHKRDEIFAAWLKKRGYWHERPRSRRSASPPPVRPRCHQRHVDGPCPRDGGDDGPGG